METQLTCPSHGSDSDQCQSEAKEESGRVELGGLSQIPVESVRA